MFDESASMARDAVEKNTAEAELDRAKRLIQKMAERTTDRGCTEEEALSAAEKIADLLRQFDLRLDEVIIREERCVQREVYAADQAMGTVISGIRDLCSLIAYIDNRATGVTTYVLFGMERDIELGVYLYEICHEAADEGWAEYIQSTGRQTTKQRESFRMGFADRLFQRFMELKEERDRFHREQRAKVEATGTDLVLVRDRIVEEEFAKTGIRLTRAGRGRRASDSHAYGQGHSAADAVNLNSPLGGGSGVAGHIR